MITFTLIGMSGRLRGSRTEINIDRASRRLEAHRARSAA
jgi:hypothetical protein